MFREKHTNSLQIFYGASLLERIPDSPDHITYRTAGGRLYNAGLNRQVLSQTFKVDRRTLQSWGKALLLDDKNKAIRILSGGRNKKLTPEITQYSKMRFFKIYPNNHYSYSKEIREEIETVFEITLSGEALRPHFNKWKCEIGEIPLENQDKSNKNSHGHCECDNSVNESSTVLPVGLCFASQLSNRKLDVSKSKVPLFIRHAGIVLFSQYLARIDEVFGSKGSILKQWLAIFFLESVNIEQSKYLDFDSLSLLLGKTIRQPFTQRQLLNDISNEETFDRLFRLNGDLCDIENCSDFYYDPHTKQYTGTQKILKGWCGSMGHPDKILNSDFIHSSNGQPLFMVHSDNYYDLRERYNTVILKFRKCFNINSSKCITMIVDRGIYSEDVLNNIAKDASQQIITWEKNFKADETLWEKNKTFHFCLKKYRNNSTDIRYYHFHYIDVTWDKNPGIRRLVVKATNPSGRTIELGILATDMKRNPDGIISLIFSRWIQENDFKYLNKHYGLNQIISYDTIDYTELATFLNDKGVVSGTYKALTYDRQQEEKRLKNLLFKKHQQTLKKSSALKQLDKVEKEIETSINKCQNNIGKNGKIIKLKKERRQLKAKLGKWCKSTLESSILECNTALENVCKQLAETKKEDSKLKTLIDQKYTSLDTRKKKLMDILKIYARNVFYHCFEYFKIEYDNFRDDHNYFRNLSHADGIMKITDRDVEIKLFPVAHLEPKIKNIFEALLEKYNKKLLVMPDGSKRKLTLSLITNKTLEVANV